MGDRVRITLALDEAPRDLLMPASFAEALAADGVAEAAWEALARSRRREVLTYLGFLKTSAALERNVRKVMADLRGERRVR